MSEKTGHSDESSTAAYVPPIIRAGGSVPSIIVAAGERATELYCAFFDTVIRSNLTRTAYGTSIRRFCRWAETRGLSLERITNTDIVAYARELNCTMANNTVMANLSALRSLLRHFRAAGLLPENSCDERLNLRKEMPERAGFDLLALLSMLANMEEESLGLILSTERAALLLLEFVRWPEGPVCPLCGQANDDAHPIEYWRVWRCPSCAQEFTVLQGTMFEGSPLAPQHWMRLIHRRILLAEAVPDDDLTAQLGVDSPSLEAMLSRLQSVLKREGIAAGDGLQAALKAKGRELNNDQFERNIIRYMVMVSARDRLLKAQAEGTEVTDLPPGMTLEQALAKLDALIAEEDRWVCYEEDGYLLRRLANEGAEKGG